MLKRFLVVDDHPIFQQGLTRFLVEEFPDAKVTEVSSGRGAMSEFYTRPLDLVTLDLSLPDMNGLEVLKEMKKEHPKTPILIVTLHSEDRYAVRAFRDGADGYLTKEGSPKVLGEAIRKVLGGGKYVSTHMAEKFAIQLGGSGELAPHERLSDREFQILGLIGQGKTTSAIGADLHLSVNTISTYRTRILEKLNLKTTAELITYAIENGLM